MIFRLPELGKDESLVFHDDYFFNIFIGCLLVSLKPWGVLMNRAKSFVLLVLTFLFLLGRW